MIVGVVLRLLAMFLDIRVLALCHYDCVALLLLLLFLCSYCSYAVAIVVVSHVFVVIVLLLWFRLFLCACQVYVCVV